MGLRPNKRELLKPNMRLCLAALQFGLRRHVAAFESADMSAHSKGGFAVAAGYSRSHVASSRAQ